MLRMLKITLADVITRPCGNNISLGNTGEDCEFYIVFDRDAAEEFARDVCEILDIEIVDCEDT